MVLRPADLEFRYSTSVGAAGNVGPRVAGTSFGKHVSQTPIASDTMHNLFGQIDDADALSGAQDYACVFLYNKHPSLGLTNTKVWIAQQTAGVADAALAVDNIPATPVGSASQQAAVIADRHNAPSGVSSWSAPTTQGSGLSLGNVGPGQVKAIWIRRTATNSNSLANDGVRLRVAGDPA